MTSDRWPTEPLSGETGAEGMSGLDQIMMTLRAKKNDKRSTVDLSEVPMR